ncbi:hypothetical protein [Flavobacterium soyae]|uniref:Uncharacterized protein n=1 Tax=Flavobacterium soyae TaxID=2903098 RepID=A0ABZ2UEV0_9FLAO
MRYTPKQSGSVGSAVIPFLKKYGIYIIALFLLFPYLYKYFKNMVESVKNTNLEAEQTRNSNENSRANPEIIKQKVRDIKIKYPKVSSSVMDGIVASAFKIADSFGVGVHDYSTFLGIKWFNPTDMTEDEKSAMKFLKKHTGTFSILEDVYYKTATKSRNLREDLIEYLSNEQYDELAKFYKSKGYNWL